MALKVIAPPPKLRVLTATPMPGMAVRPTYQGDYSGTRSFEFAENGVHYETLLPVLGENETDEAVIARYQRTGQHLGKFEPGETATRYAESLDKSKAPARAEEARLTAQTLQAAGEAVPIAPLRGKVLPDPSKPEDTLAGGLAKVGRQIPSMFKAAGGGILQAMSETGGDPEVALYPEFAEVLAEARREAIRHPASAPGAHIVAQAQADLAANAPNVDPLSIKGIAIGAAQSIPSVLTSLAAGLLTRSPAVGYSVLAAQAGGQQYGESRADKFRGVPFPVEPGRSPEASLLDATVNGVAEVIGERIPVGIIMKEGGKFFPRVLKAAAAEGVQETITEIIQTGYDKGVLTPNMPWGEAWRRVVQSGIVGSVVGGGIAAGRHPFKTTEEGVQQPDAKARALIDALAADPAEQAPKTAEAIVRPIDPQDIRPGDIESPIPTELLAEGRRRVREASAMPGPPLAPPATVPAGSATVSRATEVPSDDQADRQGLPGEVGVGAQPIQAQPLERPGAEAARPGGVLQAPAEGTGAPVQLAEIAPQPTPARAPAAAPAPATSETPRELQPATSVPERPPIKAAPMEDDKAVTPAGTELGVRYAIVSANDLVASHTPEGNENPNYPQELQPRDRTRAGSLAQVADMAGKLTPRLLDKTAEAGSGAPIVSAGGIVESGNGRVMAITKAYGENLPSAAGYAEHLAKQGYPVQGIERPVLVRIRTTPMTTQEVQAFTRESNMRTTLAMSGTERAFSDAAAIKPEVLELYRGGEVAGAGNREFVRAFMRDAVGKTDQAGLIGPDGALSQEAIRRVEGALLAKAYGSKPLVSTVVESTDSNIRNLGGAMLDVAGPWAQMVQEAKSGKIAADADATASLVKAVELVERARQNEQNIRDYVGQDDVFSGKALDPMAEAFLRLMFRDTVNWKNPVGREKLTDALRFYVEQARKTTPGVDMLGEKAPPPAKIVGLAKEKQERSYGGAAQQQPTLPQRAPGDGGRVPARGAKGAGPAAPAAAPPRGGKAPGAGGKQPVEGTVRSKSGRVLVKPRVDSSTEGKLRNSLKRVDVWLHKEALAEVTKPSTGSVTKDALQDYQANLIRAMDPDRLKSADRAMLNEVLFGAEEVNLAAATRVDIDEVATFMSSQRGWTVDDLYERAQINQNTLTAIGNEIAEEFGEQFVPAPTPGGIKVRATAEEKIERKGYPDASRLTDIIRGSFVISDPSNDERIVMRLREMFRMIDEDWQQNPAGYMDRKLLVQFSNGQIGEVNFRPITIHKASGTEGHKLYEQERSSKDPVFKARLQQQQRSLYMGALADLGPEWAGIIKKAGSGGSVPKVLEKISSDITRPELKTSVPSTSTQAPPSSRMAAARPVEGSKAAGRKSQLQRVGITENIGQEEPAFQARDTLPPEDTGEAPAPGQRFLVFRVGGDRETSLAGRNAGTSDAVASHLARFDDGMAPVFLGQNPTTVYAYEVTVDAPFGKYRGQGGREADMEGTVGRGRFDGQIAYSFPRDGYTARLIRSVPLEQIRGKLPGRSFDESGSRDGAAAIRAAFEAPAFQAREEPGALDAQGNPLPQLVIPGAERSEAQRKAAMTDRQRLELKARMQQSMVRRGGQAGVDTQAGGLFGAKQETLFRARQMSDEELEQEIDTLAAALEKDKDNRDLQRQLVQLFQESDARINRILYGGARARDTLGDTSEIIGDNVELRYTEQFLRARQRVAGAIRKMLDERGLEQVQVRVADSIAAGGKPMDGFYTHKLITAAVDVADLDGLVNHEIIHALKRLGMFTPSEWRILEAEAKRRWRAKHDRILRQSYIGKVPDDVVNEEAIAFEHSDWAKGQSDASPFAQRMFQRIKDFLTALRNVLRGNGFDSPDRIFRRVQAGDIGRRGQVAEGTEEGESFQTAYHGTPYEVDRFSTDRIGTGQGAQTYGWGLYFAGKREVAEHYRESLSRNRDRQLSNGEKLPNWVANRLEDGRASVDELIQDFTGRVAEFRAKAEAGDHNAATAVPGLESIVASLEGVKRGEVTLRPKSRLYQVDLKPTEDQYLDLDKKLTEQSDFVRKALGVPSQADIVAADRAYTEAQERYHDGPMFGEQGAAEYRAFVEAYQRTRELRENADFDGHTFYRELGRNLMVDGNVPSPTGGRYDRDVADRLASEHLLKLGIRGNRYLDQGSRGAGEGTSNYVIFDDKDVEIEAAFQARGTTTAPRSIASRIGAPMRSPGFYSALTESIEGLEQSRASPEQWRNTINNLKGVKQEEVKLSGVVDWLAQQEGQVTKADLTAFLRENEVAVHEVVRTMGAGARHYGFSFNGGKNYTELTLTLPRLPGKPFKDRDWDEPNVVAHVRLKERMVNGDRVLFIEEVQSNMHQSGAVPGAPFRQSWPDLVMKRMFRYAAENGFDKIAWVTGDLQAERSGGNPKFMRDLYDVRMRSAVNRFARQWGTEVGTTVVPTHEEGAESFKTEEGSWMIRSRNGTVWPGEGEFQTKAEADSLLRKPVHSVDITPQMKSAAMAGQPVFQARDTTTAEPPPTQAPGTLTPPPGLPKYAGNINLERLGGPDDIKEAIDEIATVNGGFEGMRRGRISQEETEQMAAELGMTPRQLLRRREGRAFNSEQALAARQIMWESGKRLVELAQKAQGGTDAEVLEFQQALTLHVAIQEQVAGITAEAGRALAQFNIVAKESQRSAAIKNLLEEFGGRGRIEELAEIMSRLSTPEDIAKMARKVHRPTVMDMVLEFWINMLLSGPQTQVVNAVGNLANAVLNVPETATAAALGVFRKRGDKVMAREVAATTYGLISGVRSGAIAAGRAFVTEEGADVTERQRMRAIPSLKLRRGRANKTIAGVNIPFTGEIALGGKQVRIPGRTLLAADEFFRQIAMQQSIRTQAYNVAANEGLRGKPFAKRVTELQKNPTEEMEAEAKAFADRQTFQTKLGKTGQDFQRILNRHKWARFLVPFVRTPVNITKSALQRLPTAYLFEETRNDLLGRNGGRKADMARARMLMGSTLATAIVSLALEGLVSGGGPDDPQERAELYETGWQPYSLKIGNKWVPYGRVEPFATIMGIAADAAEIFSRTGDAIEKGELADSAAEIAALVTGAIATNLTNKTFLRGISDAIAAVNDPVRYGENWAQSMSGTLIPTGVAQYARSQDPYIREANGALDNFRTRIPGMSQTLPVRRGPFGEPVRRPGEGNFINPFPVTTVNPDPVANEVVRLDIRIPPVPRELQGIELTAAQRDRLAQGLGRMTKQALALTMSTPLYGTFSDEGKKFMLNEVLKTVRGDIIQAFTEGAGIDVQSGVNKAQELIELGRQFQTPVAP